MLFRKGQARSPAFMHSCIISRTSDVVHYCSVRDNSWSYCAKRLYHSDTVMPHPCEANVLPGLSRRVYVYCRSRRNINDKIDNALSYPEETIEKRRALKHELERKKICNYRNPH